MKFFAYFDVKNHLLHLFDVYLGNTLYVSLVSAFILPCHDFSDEVVENSDALIPFFSRTIIEQLTRYLRIILAVVCAFRAVRIIRVCENRTRRLFHQTLKRRI